MGNSPIQRVRRRALCALGAMIAGIVIARGMDGPIGSGIWFSLACGCVGGSIVVRGWGKSALMVLAVVMLGAGLVTMRTHETPSDRLDRMVGVHGLGPTNATRTGRIPIEIRGVLIESIRTAYRPKGPGEPPMWGSTSVTTSVRIDGVLMHEQGGRSVWTRASGIARVHLPRSFADRADELGQREMLGAGDRVELLGVYTPSGRARNFGDLDWHALGAQGGRVGSIIVSDGSMIHRIEHQSARGRVMGALGRWRSGLKNRSLAAIGMSVSRDHGLGSSLQTGRSMLAALLLGERDPGFGRVYESFQRVGVAHVLAISGFHLALVIFLGVLVIRLIGEHPIIETLIMISILVLGTMVIELRPPIVRAGVIVLALLISARLGRRYDRLTVLGWVGVGLLVWRPMDVYSLGYQLSMGITALLIILSHRDPENRGENMAMINRATFTTAKMKHAPGRFGKLRLIITETIKANFACWLVALPAIAFHAGIVSVLAPLVSLVLIPMVVVLMIVGYLQIAIGVIDPELAGRTIGLVDWLSGLSSRLIVWIDGFGWSSISVGSTGVWWTIAATLLMGMLVTRRWKLRSAKPMGAGLVMVVWAMGAGVLGGEPAALRIDMIDVGDGSCVLIQSDGEGLIWDCGSLDRRVGSSAARAARSVGLTKISDAIVTHDNIDHFNGLLDLGPKVGLERVWITRRMIDEPSASWRRYQIALEEIGIEILDIEAGDSIELGSASIECLWPEPAKIGSSGDGMSQNNTSAVVRIRVDVDGEEDRTVLLSGDIERNAMNAIIKAYPDLRCDVLELPHHGSAKAGSFGFVEGLDPSVVLQSTGPSRLNDRRWDRVREGRHWYATAERGGVWVRIMNDGRIEHGWAMPND